MSGSAVHGTGAGLCPLLGHDLQRMTALIEALAARRWTVAAAESLTAGLLTAALTEVPGSSAVLRGGIVCYATDLKSTLVGVDPGLLECVGPVDPDVARQLATGIRDRCAARIGIGLTGVAGPTSQGGQPPGTVFVGLASPAGSTVRRLSVAPVTRFDVRAAAVRCAVEELERLVGEGTVRG